MNYEEFKTKVKEEFMNFLPEEYQHLQLDIRPVEKVNVVKDGMSFVNNEKNHWVSPTIYLDDMFQNYQKVGNCQEVFVRVAEVVTKAFNNSPVKEQLDFAKAKDNIVFQLINSKQNKELLKSLPHRELHDLSIIYRWVVGRDEEGIQSAVIRNEHMEHLGLNEEQLFKLAEENYKRLLPPTMCTMDEVMRDVYLAEGVPEEMVKHLLPKHTFEETIWIISNEIKINGAASMLYDDMLQEIAKNMDSDLYILPSSVHETLAVSVNLGDPYKLAKMVNEVNMNDVDLGDRLSNQVYHYDRELHKLTMATNTPIKRLDGLVAEPQQVYGSVDRSR